MKIQLVSYINSLPVKERIELTANVINESKADLILFSGNTIATVKDVHSLGLRLNNKDVEAIIEVQSDYRGIPGALYHLKKGVITNLYTNQLFKDSNEVNEELVDWLINELETRRKFTVCGKVFTILQCGENSILRNIQSDGNRAVFRFDTEVSLTTRFSSILKEVDVFLNPIHTPMGNQGKMSKRREFFSFDHRCYFSTSNTNKESPSLGYKLQYAYYNGKSIDENELFDDDSRYIIRVYEI